jgi:nucleoside-diphosphate-sugar epimerase
MKTILITGATGFLGSNIARFLVRKGYQVYATHRNNSSFKRCEDFYDLIEWINTENAEWKKSFSKIKIDIVIHTAWQGVSANERDNWEIQLSNFKFSTEIYEFAKSAGTKKIITLGSQAEYGIYNAKVDEDYTPVPVDAYGSVKLLILYFLRNFALNTEIEWYWIRVFSVFGKDENENWLLPDVIKNLLKGIPVELTEGHQKYDYLHSDEFVKNLYKVIESASDNSGIYNLCTGNAIEIKSLLIKLTKQIPNSEHLLKFGKIPYRKNQNMFMVGDNKKFESIFGPVSVNDMDSNLQKTINLYKEK